VELENRLVNFAMVSAFWWKNTRQRNSEMWVAENTSQFRELVSGRSSQILLRAALYPLAMIITPWGSISLDFI